MSKLREFFVKLPEVCGVEPEVACMYGEHLGKLFDHEVKNPESVFRYRPGQSPRARLAPAFAGWSGLLHTDNLGKLEYARNLAVLCATSYAFTKGIADQWEVDELAEILYRAEPAYPEIAALMSVDEAATLTNWN